MIEVSEEALDGMAYRFGRCAGVAMSPTVRACGDDGLALVAALREARQENERLRDVVAAVHERLERSDWIVARELLRLIDSAGAR